jgi:hypothetical protein
MTKNELIAELTALDIPAHRSDLISLRDYARTLADRFGATDYLEGTLARLKSICYVSAVSGDHESSEGTTEHGDDHIQLQYLQARAPR